MRLKENHVRLLNALWTISKEGVEWVSMTAIADAAKMSTVTIKPLLKQTCTGWITKRRKDSSGYRFSKKGITLMQAGEIKIWERKTKPSKKAEKPQPQLKPETEAPSQETNPN